MFPAALVCIESRWIGRGPEPKKFFRRFLNPYWCVWTMNFFKRCHESDALQKEMIETFLTKTIAWRVHPENPRRFGFVFCQFRSSKCLSSSPEFSISQKPVRTTLCPKCHGDPTQFMSIHFPFQMAWKAVRTYCGTHHVSFNYTMQIKRYVYREQARNESPGNGLALSLCPRLFGAASGFWNLDIHWRLTSDCTYDFRFSWTTTVIFSDPYTF